MRYITTVVKFKVPAISFAIGVMLGFAPSWALAQAGGDSASSKSPKSKQHYHYKINDQQRCGTASQLFPGDTLYRVGSSGAAGPARAVPGSSTTCLTPNLSLLGLGGTRPFVSGPPCGDRSLSVLHSPRSSRFPALKSPAARTLTASDELPVSEHAGRALIT